MGLPVGITASLYAEGGGWAFPVWPLHQGARAGPFRLGHGWSLNTSRRRYLVRFRPALPLSDLPRHASAFSHHIPPLPSPMFWGVGFDPRGHFSAILYPPFLGNIYLILPLRRCLVRLGSVGKCGIPTSTTTTIGASNAIIRASVNR